MVCTSTSWSVFRIFSFDAKAAQVAFLARFGSRLGSGVEIGLGLRPYLDSTRKYFLVRKKMQYVNGLPPLKTRANTL